MGLGGWGGCVCWFLLLLPRPKMRIHPCFKAPLSALSVSIQLLSWGDMVLFYLHAQYTPGSCRSKLIIRLMQVTFLPSPGLESLSCCMKHSAAWLPENIQALEVSVCNFCHPLFPCVSKPLKELIATLKIEGVWVTRILILFVWLTDWLNRLFLNTKWKKYIFCIKRVEGIWIWY